MYQIEKIVSKVLISSQCRRKVGVRKRELCCNAEEGSVGEEMLNRLK